MSSRSATVRRLGGGPAVVPLRTAVLRQREIPGFLPNSYGWYRMIAASQGHMSVGSRCVPAKKVRGMWCLEANRFEVALAVAIRQGRRWLRSDAYSIAYLKGRKRI